jgi:hypothetical protein
MARELSVNSIAKPGSNQLDTLEYRVDGKVVTKAEYDSIATEEMEAALGIGQEAVEEEEVSDEEEPKDE